MTIDHPATTAKRLATAAVAVALAGAAQAQTIAPAPDAARPILFKSDLTAASLGMNRRNALQSSIDIANARAALALPYAQAHALEGAGISRTEVDHQFAPDGAVGAVGYLCGIRNFAPGTDDHGGGPDAGYGREGTFLGAKLSLPFR